MMIDATVVRKGALRGHFCVLVRDAIHFSLLIDGLVIVVTGEDLQCHGSTVWRRWLRGGSDEGFSDAGVVTQE